MRRDFLRQLMGGLMALCCGRAARAWATPRSAPQAIGEHDLTARREWLTTGQWRIWSIAFQLLPADGYPVQFRSDGGVSSEHWKVSRSWRLPHPDELLLYGSEQDAAIRFGFDAEHQVFVAWVAGRLRSLYAIIGLAGTDFPAIAERLLSEAPRRASQHAPN